MKKVAVIAYHKRANIIYDPEWIERCSASLKAQTHDDFDIIEMDYNGGTAAYFKDVRPGYLHISMDMENHIEAMNFLISKAFEDGYDAVFNTNIDDFYHPQRIELQLKKLRHYDLVSSNFSYVDSQGKWIKDFDFSKVNICTQLRKNHNVIAHPAVAMKRSFWDDDLHYHNLLGKEDLDLWQRAAKKFKRMYITPENLLFYRIHDNQVTKFYGSV